MTAERTAGPSSRRSRRRRVSISQLAQEIGPRLRTGFRKARVALWRFKRSPAQQDRAAMVATFAFIGLFAIGSVDAIITGRADFAPGSAHASEYRPERIRAPAADLALQPSPVEEDAVKSAAESDIDYSVTAEVLLGGPPDQQLASLPAEHAGPDGEKLAAEPAAEVQAEKISS